MLPTMKIAFLSTLLMSSAVSANYQPRNVHNGRRNHATRAIDNAEAIHVEKRSMFFP